MVAPPRIPGFGQEKGIYIDGHEREDVVTYHQKYLRKMVSLGFINKDNAPTQETAQCLPEDLRCPPKEQLEKTIVLFHDESIFSANEDQGSQWDEKDNFAIKPKSKGSGIMISDFIDEVNGYLRLSDTEYSLAKVKYGKTLKKKLESIWNMEKVVKVIGHQTNSLPKWTVQ